MVKKVFLKGILAFGGMETLMKHALDAYFSSESAVLGSKT